MRLTDLEPRFRRLDRRIEPWTRVSDQALWDRTGRGDQGTEQIVGPRDYYVPVATLAEADGVEFLCPKCFVANGGKVGTHHVICWQPRVPLDAKPGPGRWTFSGTGLHDLTLSASSSSILLIGGCAWHGFITNGEVTNA